MLALLSSLTKDIHSGHTENHLTRV